MATAMRPSVASNRPFAMTSWPMPARTAALRPFEGTSFSLRPAHFLPAQNLRGAVAQHLRELARKPAEGRRARRARALLLRAPGNHRFREVLMAPSRLIRLFSLVALALGACSGSERSLCQTAADHAQECLAAYCAGHAGEPVCEVAAAPAAQVTTCDEAQAATTAGQSCDALLDEARASMSGKADAPCPWYFSWCGNLAPRDAGYRVTVVSFEPGRMVLEVALTALTKRPVVVGGATYQQVSVAGAGTTEEVGAPELPALGALLAFPPDTDQAFVEDVEVLEQSNDEGVRVAPFRRRLPGEADPAPAAPDPARYGQVEPYPAVPVALGALDHWRGITVARLAVHPARVVPAWQRLSVDRRLRVTVGWHEQPGVDGPPAPTGAPDDAQRALIANVDEATGAAPPRDEPQSKYLFIVDDKLAAAVQPLVDLKTAQGLSPTVTLASSLGSPLTAEAIHAHVASMYRQRGIEYALLVGDLDVIPMYQWGEYPSDLWYGLIEGNDLFAEVSLGRLVARTPEELAPVVAKILAYANGDAAAAWRKKILLVAHEQEYPGKYTQASEAVRTYDYGLKSPIEFAKIYGGEGGTNEQVMTAINDGVGIVAYRGHGDTGEWWEWGKSGSFFANKQTFTNAEKTPVVLSLACLNLNLPDPSPTLGEQFVNLGAGGAVAFLGATQPSYTIPNHDFEGYLFRGILEDGVTSLGKVLLRANAALVKQYGAESYATENVRMYAILGDPMTTLGTGYLCDPHVTAEAGPDTTIAAGQWVQLGGPPQPGATYRWEPATDLSCTDCANPKATPQQTTTYTVTVESTCNRRKDSVTVTVGGSQVPVGWGNLQWPFALYAEAGQPSDEVFGQVWMSGVTDQAGPGAGIVAQLGYGPVADPPTAASWTWVDAVYNVDSGNNDELKARLTVPAAGTYAYTFRYQYRGGPWTYGDRSDEGRKGSSDGFQPENAGFLTVIAAPVAPADGGVDGP
jgi:hypothetical protein